MSNARLMGFGWGFSFGMGIALAIVAHWAFALLAIFAVAACYHYRDNDYPALSSRDRA